MTDKLGFEQITLETEIPALVKHPTSRQLVKYAGASGDYNPIHYDRDVAAARGLPGIVVHGQLVSACLIQMITDWLDNRGVIRKFSVSYKAMTFPGEPFTCRGTVARKSDNDERQLTLAIWAENPRGEKAVSGTAIIHILE